MHRFVWGLHYPPPTAMRHDYPISAIPHDTPRFPLGPTVLPETYTIRLTVDGKSSTAPLTVKMDPRIKTPAAGLEKKFQAEMRMASLMSASAQAQLLGESLRAQLEKLGTQPSAPVADAIAAIDKKLTALLGAPGGFFAPPSTEVTLGRINGQAATLYQQVWQADDEPTSSQMDAIAGTERASADVLKRWNEFKSTDLPALNRALRESKLPEIQLEADAHREEPQVDEE